MLASGCSAQALNGYKAQNAFGIVIDEGAPNGSLLANLTLSHHISHLATTTILSVIRHPQYTMHPPPPARAQSPASKLKP